MRAFFSSSSSSSSHSSPYHSSSASSSSSSSSSYSYSVGDHVSYVGSSSRTGVSPPIVEILAIRSSPTPAAFITWVKPRRDSRFNQWVNTQHITPLTEYKGKDKEKEKEKGRDCVDEIPHVKNVDRLHWGEYLIDCWYYSPYPPCINGHCDTLFVCSFCLKYTRRKDKWESHQKECLALGQGRGSNQGGHDLPLSPSERRRHRGPSFNPWMVRMERMGRRIYEDSPGEGSHPIVVFEFDGGFSPSKLYCQCLCLLAKLFIDHKTIFFDVSHFKFYALYDVDPHTGFPSLAAYFSKEKNPTDNNNLACILTFPHFQNRGFGKFLISLSYEISRREKKIGGPERPLSDLGRVSYESFWKATLVHTLIQLYKVEERKERRRWRDKKRRTGPKSVPAVPPPVELHVELPTLSEETGIAIRDVLHIGTVLNLLRLKESSDSADSSQASGTSAPSEDAGDHIHEIVVSHKDFVEFSKYDEERKRKQREAQAILFDPEQLKWSPKTTVKSSSSAFSPSKRTQSQSQTKTKKRRRQTERRDRAQPQGEDEEDGESPTRSSTDSQSESGDSPEEDEVDDGDDGDGDSGESSSGSEGHRHVEEEDEDEDEDEESSSDGSRSPPPKRARPTPKTRRPGKASKPSRKHRR